MAETIFDKIQAQIKTGKEPFEWYRNRIKEMGSPTAQQLVRDGKLTGSPNFGRMNLYFYDPKFKKELPYYDKFPLVIPIESYDNGFLGINFHYLPYALRARLLDRLYEFEGGGKININWKDVANIRQVKPCVKRYLASNVRSRFRRIDEEDFVTAIMLPVQQFEKASDTKVWSDSRKMI